MSLNLGQRLSRTVVFLLMGAALVAVTVALVPRRAAFVLVTLLLVEGWLLANKYADDTLSESVWALASRPLVPWLFGIATGWSICAGYLVNPWLVLAAGAVSGHFVWQSADVYKAIAKKEDTE